MFRVAAVNKNGAGEFKEVIPRQVLKGIYKLQLNTNKVPSGG